MPDILGLSCHWLGPLSDQEGFAEEGRSLVAALRQAGVRVAEHDIPHPRTFDNIAALRITSIQLERTDVVPCIYHRYWSALPAVTRGVHIWRTMFETNGIPPDWVHISHSYDAIWVPSEFNRRTYIASGVAEQKLVVVPCPLPTWTPLLVSNLENRDLKGSNKKFRFLSVMRWHRRKGWDIVIPAFINEFGHEPDVELMIKARPFDPRQPYQPYRELSDFLSLHRLPWPPNLKVITNDISIESLAQLYRDADAFVLASRGEGWGRPLMEAMLSGLPTIGPRWGGNLSFMNDGNSVLIDGEVVPVTPEAADEWPYFRGQLWFEPNSERLQSAMRYVATGQADARSRSDGIVRSLLSRYSTAKIGEQMSTALRSLI